MCLNLKEIVQYVLGYKRGILLVEISLINFRIFYSRNDVMSIYQNQWNFYNLFELVNRLSGESGEVVFQ